MVTLSTKQKTLLSFLHGYTLHHSDLNSDNITIAEQAILQTHYTLQDVLTALELPLSDQRFVCKYGSFIVDCDPPSVLDKLLGNEAEVKVKFVKNFCL